MVRAARPRSAPAAGAAGAAALGVLHAAKSRMVRAGGIRMTQADTNTPPVRPADVRALQPQLESHCRPLLSQSIDGWMRGGGQSQWINGWMRGGGGFSVGQRQRVEEGDDRKQWLFHECLNWFCSKLRFCFNNHFLIQSAFCLHHTTQPKRWYRIYRCVNLHISLLRTCHLLLPEKNTTQHQC